MNRLRCVSCMILVFLCTIVLLSAAGRPETSSADAGSLRVYAVITQDDAEMLTDMFREQTGVDVSFIRATTGELVNRVIAEQNNPQADILLGGASLLHTSIARAGALESYRSPNAEGLPAFGVDPDGYWTGFYVTSLGIGVNEDRFRRLFGDTPIPESWDDLLDPRFDGEIVMTDPLASSTAYLFLQTQLQRLGWEAGWDYLETLAPLVGQFPTSGGAPPQLIGSGEFAIGVAFVHALSRYRRQGFPLTVRTPAQTGGEVGAISIVRGGPNPENARRFVDFILSVEAQQAFVDQSLVTPLSDRVVLPEAAVGIQEIDLIDYDSELAGQQRSETLERWQQIVD